MTELPEPLTPQECDLRDFAWMPLDVLRLRDSEIAAIEDPEAFRCAMMLCCASWHQIPAASIPMDEKSLARLAGYGRDMKTFQRAVAAGGMRGWIKCSDGRMYHPVVAQKANESWAMKLASIARTAKARAARHNKSATPTEPSSPPVTVSVTEPVTDTTTHIATTRPTERATEPVTEEPTDDVTGSTVQDRTVQDKRKKEPPSLRESPPPRPPSSVAASGSRLPDGWEPPPDCVDFAQTLGLSAHAILPGFRDYWRSVAGAKARKADWPATWRNWCRREAKPPPACAKPDQRGQQLAKLAAIRAREAERDAAPALDLTAIEHVGGVQ